jgi:hypothetical protein
MHLTWHAANGDTLVIADPSQAVPEPMFRYLSSDGFGGTDNEIQTRRGAYQDGTTLQQVRLSPRTLMIRFLILAADRAGVEQKRRRVAAAFNPRNGLGTLVWTQEDGSQYALRCVALSGSPTFLAGRTSQGRVWQEVVVDLQAPDPCWFDATATTLPLAGLTGGLAFPASFPASFAAMGSTMVVTNEGDIAAPVRIQIPGPCLNPVVENLTTGEQIALTLDVLEGQTVLIDTAYGNLLCRLQASNGTQTNAMQYLSSDSTFWQLLPGENIVTFSTPGGSAEVSIEYASRYTGV